ncbi:MAG TPA: glycerophosphodiester phosphodiesterase family protein [Longimicrobiales bacterium]|nr:glycerophosphodiester phosphodiesterase family protein [Longimicrobiales bacterium]
MSQEVRTIGAALSSAAHRLLRLWRPMAAWTVLVWAAAALVATPLSSWLLGAAVMRGRRDLVGNEDLLGWVMTAPGFLWVLLAGSLVLVALVIRFAGLFYIITDDLEGERPGLYRTILDLAPRVPALFRLCMATVGAGIILALPLFGGLALIRATVFGAYDINYYLAERPDAWSIALLAAGLWIAAWGVPVAYLAGRAVLAIPARLDGHDSIRAAIQRAWRRTGAPGSALLPRLLVAAAGWFAVRTLADATYAAAGAAAVSWVAGATDSPRNMVVATATYFGGLVVIDAVIGFLGFAFLSTLVTKHYYEDTDLHAQVPAVRRLRDVPAQTLGAFRRRFRPARAVPLLAVLALASMALSGVFLDRVPDPEPLRVIAHRAGPPPAPENTLAALERAIAGGADMAEIDVQRTRDGVVVVIHDADLMRMAGSPQRVRESLYVDLAGLVQRPDDGSPPAERGVATLGEFLERARDRIMLMIELKLYGPDPGLAEAVIREVRHRGMGDQVVLMSLDLAAVQEAARLAPDIPVGYVVAATVGDPTALPVQFLAVAVPRLTPRLERQARQRGHEIHAWTVNRPADMVALSVRGIDGVITDDPAMAAQVNARLSELSPASRILLRFLDPVEDDDR